MRKPNKTYIIISVKYYICYNANGRSNFVNQFVPKRTARANMWAVKIFQTWAIKKQKNPDIKAYNENELRIELRKFDMDLKQQDVKLYSELAMLQ